MSLSVLESENKNLKELVLCHKKHVDLLENMIIRNDKNHTLEVEFLKKRLDFKQEAILVLVETGKMHEKMDKLYKNNCEEKQREKELLLSKNLDYINEIQELRKKISKTK